MDRGDDVWGEYAGCFYTMNRKMQVIWQPQNEYGGDRET